MKYYMITGEASGDLHGSNLAKALLTADPKIQIRAWGGALLRQAGAEVVKDYKDLAFMGFIDVAKNIKTILKNIRFCKEDILNYRPDAVILVDYPGFNLRMAKFLHRQRIPVFYYISPQVWAWHKSRVKDIKKYVDEMFVILPFEEQFYAERGLKVHYFGHPLSDVVRQYRISDDFRGKNQLDERKIIAILPGSRRQEIVRMLPIMLAVAQRTDGYQYIIAGVENHRTLYEKWLKDANISILYNQTYDVLGHAHAAMVTSGTATLETALFNVPQVVCYRADYLSYWIARNLVKGINYISLVNLIANREVVTELIQNSLTANALSSQLRLLLEESPKREQILNDYAQLHLLLGDGNTSQMISGKIREKSERMQLLKER